MLHPRDRVNFEVTVDPTNAGLMEFYGKATAEMKFYALYSAQKMNKTFGPDYEGSFRTSITSQQEQSHPKHELCNYRFWAGWPAPEIDFQF